MRFLLLLSILLTGISVHGQNVDFHKHMDNAYKAVDKINKEVDDVGRHIRKAENAKEPEDAQDQFKKALELIEDALDQEKKLQKALKKANAAAKNYECFNTVKLLNEVIKAADNLISEVDDARKIAKDGTGVKKMKKVGKPAGELKKAIKAIGKKNKDFEKEMKEADASCT